MRYLITGTRKGIGRALALHYLGQGDSVLGCSRGESSIKHDLYTHYKLDVSDESAVTKMVRGFDIDVLINNAGTSSMSHLLLTSKKSALEIMNTNFMGTFLFTREVAKQSKQCTIINFSTIAVPLNIEGEAVYASSKSAVEELTRISSRELMEKRMNMSIRVNAIGIAPTMTDMIKSVPTDKIAALIEKQSIKRLGTIKDIIQVIDFYVSAEFITGQTIYMGGICGS